MEDAVDFSAKIALGGLLTSSPGGPGGPGGPFSLAGGLLAVIQIKLQPSEQHFCLAPSQSLSIRQLPI